MQDFTTHKFNLGAITADSPVTVVPLGDIHRDNEMCAEDKWRETLAWMKKLGSSCYVLGMGDYLDFLSTSERHKVISANLHDSTMQTFDQIMMKHVQDICKEIAFLKGRIIGLVEGNHYGQFSYGMTTTQKMCELLDCQYLGTASFIRLQTLLGAHAHVIDIFAHHGKGASRLMGGSLNTVENTASFVDADCVLMGHDHKRSVAFINKLGINAGGGVLRLRNRKVLIARTGSFLKGYEPGTPSYVARKALPPCDLGVVKIQLGCKYIGKDRYIDIGASI